jgi:hypothetical protein
LNNYLSGLHLNFTKSDVLKRISEANTTKSRGGNSIRNVYYALLYSKIDGNLDETEAFTDYLSRFIKVNTNHSEQPNSLKAGQLSNALINKSAINDFLNFLDLYRGSLGMPSALPADWATSGKLGRNRITVDQENNIISIA